MIDLDIASEFIKMFNRDKKNLDFLVSSAVPKRVLLRIYEVFLKEENLTKIEDLPEEEKRKLVDECRTTEQVFTNKSLTEAARILHTLKFIINAK